MQAIYKNATDEILDVFLFFIIAKLLLRIMGLSKTDSFLCGMPMMTQAFRTRSILAPTSNIKRPI